MLLLCTLYIRRHINYAITCAYQAFEENNCMRQLHKRVQCQFFIHILKMTRYRPVHTRRHLLTDYCVSNLRSHWHEERGMTSTKKCSVLLAYYLIQFTSLNSAGSNALEINPRVHRVFRGASKIASVRWIKPRVHRVVTSKAASVRWMTHRVHARVRGFSLPLFRRHRRTRPPYSLHSKARSTWHCPPRTRARSTPYRYNGNCMQRWARLHPQIYVLN